VLLAGTLSPGVAGGWITVTVTTPEYGPQPASLQACAR